jgi:hypothetical protein
MHESDTVSAQPQLSETRLQSLLRVSSSLANALHLEAVYNTVISEGKQTLGARAFACLR